MKLLLKERLGIGEQTRAIIAFGDPFTTPIDDFMKALDSHAAGIPLMGGMASSAGSRGTTCCCATINVWPKGWSG